MLVVGGVGWAAAKLAIVAVEVVVVLVKAVVFVVVVFVVVVFAVVGVVVNFFCCVFVTKAKALQLPWIKPSSLAHVELHSTSPPTFFSFIVIISFYL